MKKIMIIAAVLVTTGATALSLSKHEDKSVKAELKIEKSEVARMGAVKSDIATAD